MKDWSGKSLCFECAKKVGANINIGFQRKGRCQRCHSDQTVFEVKKAPVAATAEPNVCPECAHPAGTHAASCRLSELEQLRHERAQIVAALEATVGHDPDRPLGDQVRQALNTGAQDRRKT